MPSVCIYQQFMPPDASGAGKQALTLAKAIKRAGWDVLFLTEGERSDRNETLEGFPVERVVPVPARPSYSELLAYWTRVAEGLLRARRHFDILHIHSAHLHQMGAIPVARALRKGVIVRSSHEGEFSNFRSSRSQRLRKHLIRMADAFVLLSNRLEAEYATSGLPREKLNLIPNGVDTSIYFPVATNQKLRLRDMLGLPQSGRILVSHGVFIERKSQHWLVEVLGPRLQELDLTLLLVGGAARDEGHTQYAARLRELVDKSPARERIILREHADDVAPYLQASDSYVLASTGEGLPNALLEAMAVGLLPFASRTSGSEDVVVDGESGFLFEPRDQASFIDRLYHAYGRGHPDIASAIGAAAAERIQSHFSIAVTGGLYVEAYERVLVR